MLYEKVGHGLGVMMYEKVACGMKGLLREKFWRTERKWQEVMMYEK